MNREPRQMWLLVLSIFALSLAAPMATVSAELTTEERLAEQGLTVLALRNDLSLIHI